MLEIELQAKSQGSSLEERILEHLAKKIATVELLESH